MSNQNFQINEKVYIPHLNAYGHVVETGIMGHPTKVSIDGKIEIVTGKVIEKLTLFIQIIKLIKSLFKK
jgi:hypothetical protein